MKKVGSDFAYRYWTLFRPLQYRLTPWIIQKILVEAPESVVFSKGFIQTGVEKTTEILFYADRKGEKIKQC